MTYHRLAEAVSKAGFFTSGNWKHSMICASKIGADGTFTVINFYVDHREAGWFLGVLGGRVYRMPDPERVPELCIEWLRRRPDRLAYDIDSHIRREFDLIEVEPDDSTVYPSA